MLDAYRALEDAPHGEGRWHGSGGIWPVRQFGLNQLTPPVRAFVEAAAGLGFRRNDDFNGAEREGVGGESVNIVDGVRHNAGMVYLSADVRKRPNLTIRPDTLVDRVLFEGRRATGVRLV